jgi:hypothetical protein
MLTHALFLRTSAQNDTFAVSNILTAHNNRRAARFSCVYTILQANRNISQSHAAIREDAGNRLLEVGIKALAVFLSKILTGVL